jgi:hypothetical protein
LHRTRLSGTNAATSLETTSGALALYRSELLYDHLDAYAVECGTGDDRWLALRALRHGQVVAVAEALVETDMPSTLKGTYKQRLGWSRSWRWMLPYVGKYLGFRQCVSPVYGVIQLVISPMMVFYIVASTFATRAGRYTTPDTYILLAYVAAYVMVRYALSALYLIERPNVALRDDRNDGCRGRGRGGAATQAPVPISPARRTRPTGSPLPRSARRSLSRSRPRTAPTPRRRPLTRPRRWPPLSSPR